MQVLAPAMLLRNYPLRFVLGSGGFIGEVTLQTVPAERPDLELRKGSTLALTKLYVHPLRRGKGWATTLINHATAHADASLLTLVLWTAPYGTRGRTKVELATIYGKHGFEFIGESTTEMVRYPCSK